MNKMIFTSIIILGALLLFLNNSSDTNENTLKNGISIKKTDDLSAILKDNGVDVSLNFKSKIKEKYIKEYNDDISNIEKFEDEIIKRCIPYRVEDCEKVCVDDFYNLKRCEFKQEEEIIQVICKSGKDDCDRTPVVNLIDVISSLKSDYLFNDGTCYALDKDCQSNFLSIDKSDLEYILPPQEIKYQQEKVEYLSFLNKIKGNELGLVSFVNCLLDIPQYVDNEEKFYYYLDKHFFELKIQCESFL